MHEQIITQGKEKNAGNAMRRRKSEEEEMF